MNKTAVQFKAITRITIGEISHYELMSRARQRGINITGWGKEILTKTQPLHKRIAVDVVPICFRIDLPKVNKGSSIRPMYEEAFLHRLCLAPASVGLEVLLQTQEGSIGEAFLAMKPVWCWSEISGNKQENILSITDKENTSGARWINGTPGNMDDRISGGRTYLFVSKHPELVKAGYASLQD